MKNAKLDIIAMGVLTLYKFFCSIINASSLAVLFTVIK
jgi:hypothetical protein